jgi:hypothetical protein
VAGIVRAPATLVRSATGLQLKVLRITFVFRWAEQNSACISKPARFHGRQQETEPAVTSRRSFGHEEAEWAR